MKRTKPFPLIHHLGGSRQVTGSAHLLQANGLNILVDCGLTQGGDSITPMERWPVPPADISFLFLTHAHIDHIGRVPELIERGFKGEIISTHATRALLGPMLKDAMSFASLTEREIEKMDRAIDDLSWGFEYRETFDLRNGIRFKLGCAGHILGSCFIHFESEDWSILFSGDLGARDTPILPDPDLPESCDLLILESTYGNRLHGDRGRRIDQLGRIMKKALSDGGKVLIPAFALGRTQELLYELDRIKNSRESGVESRECEKLQTSRGSRVESGGCEKLQTSRGSRVESRGCEKLEKGRGARGESRECEKLRKGRGARGEGLECEDGKKWMGDLPPVFLDSPLGLEITRIYSDLSEFWDLEAKDLLGKGDHPMDFERLYAVRDHKDHLRLLGIPGPCIIIAGSGMCTGGRIVDHLTESLPDPATDVLFVGYQAHGTPGRELIEQAGEKERNVRLKGERIEVKGKVHVLNGYSAHADQKGLMDWVESMPQKPGEIRLVHGEEKARKTLAETLKAKGYEVAF